MPLLTVRHATIYRYTCPVTFGDHRLMLRPRDSHDLRLLATRLDITPQPSAIRWMHDVFSNSVAVVSFNTSANELRFASEIELEHFENSEPDCPLEPYAATYPFSYSVDEMPDLVRFIERHYPDAEHQIDIWAKNFLSGYAQSDTLALLAGMARAIKQDFSYMARDLEGVQTPVETLYRRTGSCRDFAVLMMEAVRALGLAARYVSGYLYMPNADVPGNVGGGATHAWIQVYLPGAGWLEYDPTNGIVGNRDLIRVAVVRMPEQAIPIAGSFTGDPHAFIEMGVEVTVSASQGR